MAPETFTGKRYCWTVDPLFSIVSAPQTLHTHFSLYVCGVVQRFLLGVCVWPLLFRILISQSASALSTS